MNLIEFIIRPVSPFVTPLKGDTLFGHYCWQVAERPELLEGGITALVEQYQSSPGVCFSSAFVRVYEQGKFFYLFTRPVLPKKRESASNGYERAEKLKEAKKRKKVKVIKVSDELVIASRLLEGNLSDDLKDNKPKEFTSYHNSISRETFTTSSGEEGFAPFSLDAFCYKDDAELSIFALYDPELTLLEMLSEAMKTIGQNGFGKEASTGYGRFELLATKERPDLDLKDAKALYALSPLVPEPDRYKHIWCEPFVRYGKHGNVDALSGNPFKNLVIMADEGAVLELKEGVVQEKSYIGQGLTGLSLSRPETIGQGYAICLPVMLED